MDSLSQPLSSTYSSNLLTTYTTNVKIDHQHHDNKKRLSFAKRVTDEDLDRVMHQVPLTQQGESQVIDVWRRYIAQRTAEEGATGQFEAMEKMIQCYWQSSSEQ